MRHGRSKNQKRSWFGVVDYPWRLCSLLPFRTTPKFSLPFPGKTHTTDHPVSLTHSTQLQPQHKLMWRSSSVLAKNSNKNNDDNDRMNHKKRAIAVQGTSTPATALVWETWTDKMTRSTKNLLYDDDDDDDDENLYMTVICCRPPSLHRGRSLPALWKLKAFSETARNNKSEKTKTSNKKKRERASDCYDDDCDTTSRSTAGGDDDDNDDNDWIPPPPPSLSSSHSIITCREDMEVRVEELRHRFHHCGGNTR